MGADNRLDPAWLAKLDDVVREAQKAGLGIILDEHDFNPCSEDVAMCRVKLSAFWRQVAPRYANAPRNVAFELLNEPHDKLDAATWNALFADLLAVVRQSNPTRIVVVGPTSWNSLHELPSMKLPADPNLLVTFHYYDPFHFTHQGATWAGEEVKHLHGITWGTDSDRAAIASDFDQVAAWSKANDRPILLGEFGVYDKSGTPIELRAAWTAASAAKPNAAASAGAIGSSKAISWCGTWPTSAGSSRSSTRSFLKTPQFELQPDEAHRTGRIVPAVKRREGVGHEVDREQSAERRARNARRP